MKTAVRYNTSFRVLRPLLYWIILVLVLFLVKAHERLNAETHIVFTPILSGHAVADETTARLDNRPVSSGDHVSLGFHTLIVEHPKASAIRKALFVRYGRNDLGEISLSRATGSLVIDTKPAAKRISVTGQEWSTVLTNSTGLTSSVPTDNYVIEAYYEHFQERHEVRVAAASPAVLRVTPNFGTITIQADTSNAFYQILSSEDRVVEEGAVPATISDVPEGRYQISVRHNRNRQGRDIYLARSTTNEVIVGFPYGAAFIGTTPPGAIVTDFEKNEVGNTPLTLAELLPGTSTFGVRLAGYEPITVVLVITPGQTNTIQRNLVNQGYAEAIRAAREALDRGDYSRAEEEAQTALAAQSGDAVASGLRQESRLRQHVALAERLGRDGNYASALREVDLALTAMPGDSRANALHDEYKQKQADLQSGEEEAKQRDRLRRIHEAFDRLLSRNKDSSLFNRHDVMVKASYNDAVVKLRKELLTRKFVFGATEQPDSNIVTMVLRQDNGQWHRLVAIAVGPERDAESKILYEVMEYKSPSALVAILINQSIQAGYVPLHPSRVGPLTESMKAQIEEGEHILAECMEGLK